MKQKLNEILGITKKDYLTVLQEGRNHFDLSKSVFLFGAGDMSLLYLNICKSSSITVDGIIDNDIHKQGRKINDYVILSPGDLRGYPRDIQIIITSVSDVEISKQLFALGFKNVWTYEYMSTVFPDVFENPCWNNSLDEIYSNKQKIIDSYNLFDDKKSQATFLKILSYRLSLDKSHLSTVVEDKKIEYFDKDIISLSPNEVFIDGGAYTGDTIEDFIKNSRNTYHKILAFEPDTVTYRKLQKYVNSKKDNRIMIYPFGLGKENKQLFFTNEGTLGSRISEEGSARINIRKIDEYIDLGITSIKLDIEGAEMDAIAGAKKTITQLHPKMMVCLYHKTSDLWNIPLLLHDYNPSYKFYLRHYTHSIYDTICYAT